MQSPQRIRSGFNFFATFYDLASFIFFGNSILHSQTFLLPRIKKCSNVLVFGGGTGKILIELMKRDVAERYCYVDISDRMIAKTRARLKKRFQERVDSVHFICGSLDDMEAEMNFDLIVTPYVLDCFTSEKLPLVMQQLHRHLTVDGEWLFADFNVPESRWGRSFSTFKIKVMYFVFNIICGLGVKRLSDFKKEFEKMNCEMTDEKYFLHGLLVARIYKAVGKIR